MTIDEEIEKFKTLSEKGHIIFSRDPDIAEKLNKEYRQIAEWLEDYKRIKMLIPIEQALKAEYNNAIDDFINAVDKHCGYYAGECKNLTRDDLLKIAKELKDNG